MYVFTFTKSKLTVPEFLYFFFDCFLGLMHSHASCVWTESMQLWRNKTLSEGGMPRL